jgi:hypothetical protein
MFFLCLIIITKTLGAPLCVHPTAGTVQPMSSELLCLGYTQSNTVDVHVRGSVLHLAALLWCLLAHILMKSRRVMSIDSASRSVKDEVENPETAHCPSSLR